MLKRKLRITIEDKVFEVEVEIQDFTTHHEFSLPSSRVPISIPKIKELAPSAISRPIEKAKGDIVAPITGRVLSIRVRKGQEIQRGKVVIVLESMKTQVEIRSPYDGVVEEILVKEGQSIRQGEVLLRLRQIKADTNT